MEINFLWLLAITGAAIAAGFCMGRLMGEEEKRPERENRRESIGRYPFLVSSPLSGEVLQADGEGRTSVRIHPAEDRLYAPANGKIVRIFPMGNAFLFRTEFGAQLCIRAGESEDELLERYYRPRVVQNEIVGKGKTLLEFDRKGLVQAGASCCVTISVETGGWSGSALAEKGEKVRAGEMLLGLRKEGGEQFGEELREFGFGENCLGLKSPG